MTKEEYNEARVRCSFYPNITTAATTHALHRLLKLAVEEIDLQEKEINRLRDLFRKVHPN